MNNKRDNKSYNRDEQSDIVNKLININRVTKVVKGGRTMRFSALVVAGDQKGKVGIGLGKAAEVPEAIKKATEEAKKNMINVALVGTTVPHGIVGNFGSGKVLILPAEEGSGVIAGGAVRLILEVCGVKDVRTKCIGTSNSINCARATMDALTKMRTAEQIASLRGKSVEDILG
ncbi:MAG: 30S ribosomal protein S5 [Clostridia bacterium]